MPRFRPFCLSFGPSPTGGWRRGLRLVHAWAGWWAGTGTVLHTVGRWVLSGLSLDNTFQWRKILLPFSILWEDCALSQTQADILLLPAFNFLHTMEKDHSFIHSSIQDWRIGTGLEERGFGSWFMCNNVLSKTGSRPPIQPGSPSSLCGNLPIPLTFPSLSLKLQLFDIH